jgi:hypothetical protein
MAADKLKGVKLQGGTYYVRIVIPADVRVAFGGKGVDQERALPSA